MECNGWKNRETWLVNLWYMDGMPDYFAEMDVFHVEHEELRDAVMYIAEECEALSQLKPGLLSDFISGCWADVDWRELAQSLNADLAEMEEEAAA